MPASHLFLIPAVFLIGALAGFIAATRRATRGAARPTALLATLGVFLVTLLATHFAPIPGGVQALKASVNHQPLFDQRPAFSSDDLLRRSDAFGATGREAYQQFTYTTDLIFPLALFLFLFALARFAGERVGPMKIPRGILRAAPILWLTADFVENGIIYFLLETYPALHAAPATLLPYVTVSKFALLLVSLVMPLAVYAVTLRKSTPIVAVA